MAGRPRKTAKKKETLEKCQCLKCKKEKTLRDHYYSTENPLYPVGKFPVCKDCITERLPKDKEPDEPEYVEMVKSILLDLNKPFILFLYQRTVDESRKTSKDFFGTYMKNLNMRQYKNYTWNDNDFEEKEGTEIRETSSNQLNKDKSKFRFEEKIYSRTWMGEYTKSDIEYLDEYYKGLDRDFKIITTNHKDYAKKICKASLHMDKCFQDMMAGVQGADKKYKDAKDAFDTLSKSAQFAESGRGQNDVSLGSFGKVFELVESKTFIPEHIPVEPDDIDKMIEDFKHIFKSL